MTNKQWVKIKIGYSDGSGIIDADNGAYLTACGRVQDAIVRGGRDEDIPKGVLRKDDAKRLVSCWNACLNLENPQEDINKLVEALKHAQMVLLGNYTCVGTSKDTVKQNTIIEIVEALALFKGE